MAEFEKANPDIAKFWQDPTTVDKIEVPDVDPSAPIYETWDIAAKRLLAKLWKAPNAWIFHEPVDAEKLEIPDYYDVVSTPMDFGTIKNKLSAD